MRILKKEQRYAMFTIYSFCKKADSINLVGNETISLSLNLGIGSKQGVKIIDGTPFLLIFKM